MAARQQALSDQAVHGLAHGDPRNAELLGQLPLRRQGLVRCDQLALDRRPQRPLQLLVERASALILQLADDVREWGQGELSAGFAGARCRGAPGTSPNHLNTNKAMDANWYFFGLAIL